MSLRLLTTAATSAVSGRVVAVAASALLALVGSSPSVDRERVVEMAEDARQKLAARQAAEALAILARALSVAESDGDALLVAAVLDLTGEAYEGAARYQDALSFYERGIQVLAAGTKGRATPEEGSPTGRPAAKPPPAEKSVSGAGGAPVSTDLYRGELPALVSLLARPSAAEQLRLALTLNAGNMYLQQSQFAAADSLYEEALARARGLADEAAVQRVLGNLAWSALKSRRFDEMDRWRGVALAGSTSPTPETRRTQLAIAVRLREEKRYDRAIASFARVVDLYERAGDARVGRVLCHLGTAYLEAGRVEEAKQRYEEALRRLGEERDVEVLWHAQGGLARAEHRQGRLEDALRHYEAYLDVVQEVGESFRTDQGRMSFLEDHQKLFEDYVEVALAVAARTGGHDAARRAVRRVSDRALPALQGDRARWPLTPPGSLPAGYILDASQAYAPWEQNTRGVPITGTAQACDVDKERVPEAVFLEYYIQPKQTAIVVHSREGDFSSRVALAAEELEKKVDAYLGLLGVDAGRGVALVDGPPISVASYREDAAREASRQLYRMLVAPVEERLPLGSSRPLVIVPHRGLWLLPFAALEDSSGVPFGERAPLTYAASETSWCLTARPERPADHRDVRAWVLGNPRTPLPTLGCQQELRLDPLPGAEAEAREVARILGPRSHVFVGAQADRMRLEAWHSAATVVHLATHGMACPSDPFSSFVALSPLDQGQVLFDPVARRLSVRGDPRDPVTLEGLSDADATGFPGGRSIHFPGLLEARTVVGRFRLGADLVTLSACQSGLGRALGQGTIGLTRAFLAAGARTVLVSLWKVDDRATRELMTAFYREYIRHGNKALALQRAMRHTRGRFPEPRLWAAFTLVGMAE